MQFYLEVNKFFGHNTRSKKSLNILAIKNADQYWKFVSIKTKYLLW